MSSSALLNLPETDQKNGCESDIGSMSNLVGKFSGPMILPVITGFLAIAVCVSGLGVFSLLVPIASATMSQGVVVVESRTQTVQTRDGGIVTDLLVHEGDSVKAGDVVLQFDIAKEKNLISTLRVQLALILARQVRVRAELANYEKLDFAQVKDGIALEEYSTIIQDQQDHFKARMSALVFRLRGLKNECEQDSAVISGLNKQLQALRVRSALSLEDLQAVSDLASTGSGTRRAVRDAHATAASLAGEQAGLEARVAEITTQISHSEIEIQRVTLAFKEEDEAELQQLTRDEQEAVQKFAEANLSLDRATIRAPVSGTVLSLSVYTIGGVANPGSTILEIVPTNQPLIIEAQIRPADSDGIVVGSPVMIRLQGIGEQRLPMIAGQVLSISADRIIDHTRAASYFLVRISVDRAKLLALRGIDLRPGIPTEVFIQSKERTLAQYVIDPLLRSFGHAMNE